MKKVVYRSVDELPLSLTVDDVADILGLSRNKAYELCHSKGFPCLRLGRRLIISRQAFFRWMDYPEIGKG